MKLTNIKLIPLTDISFEGELPQVTVDEVDAAEETETLPLPIQVKSEGFDVETLSYTYSLLGNERMLAIALALRDRDPYKGEKAPCVVVEKEHRSIPCEPIREDREIEEMECNSMLEHY